MCGQLTTTVRRIYSSPELWCAGCGDVRRRTAESCWLAEVESMRKRILSMRQSWSTLKEAVPA
ncbi:MAG: hypothetical protein ACLR9P_05910 [Escherichia coli]